MNMKLYKKFNALKIKVTMNHSIKFYQNNSTFYKYLIHEKKNCTSFKTEKKKNEKYHYFKNNNNLFNRLFYFLEVS